jgi:hypothetical protein
MIVGVHVQDWSVSITMDTIETAQINADVQIFDKRTKSTDPLPLIYGTPPGQIRTNMDK